MKLPELWIHFENRGFVTRKLWNYKTVVAYGMDNVAWAFHPDRTADFYQPCLADIKADDWILIPKYWDGSKDDYAVFEDREKKEAGARFDDTDIKWGKPYNMRRMRELGTDKG